MPKLSTDEYWYSAVMHGSRQVILPPGFVRRLQIKDVLGRTHVGIRARSGLIVQVPHPSEAFEYAEGSNGELIIVAKSGVDTSLYEIAIWGGKRSVVDHLKVFIFGPRLATTE